MIDDKNPGRKDENEPTVAPGLDSNGMLREEATREEVERGDYTEVTQLIIDRTPED
ncbi:hypothetical protein [Paenibacillus dakarensis]|uniref:hypothetical protein n=1 Tax=Paenibacillus dakarensis TaxID=1527293 RepID=UPI000AA8FD73|nr:hypothetical protein [Paenibacillus dakarensis]